MLRHRSATNISCVIHVCRQSPHCLGRLWSRVWAHFSVHMFDKDLLRCKSTCRLTPETQRKEEGVDEREGERKTHLNSGAVGAALCCLLKQMHLTSLWHLSMQTKTKLVVATPRHYVGCASLLAFAKITHNKAGKGKARHTYLHSKSRCYKRQFEVLYIRHKCILTRYKKNRRKYVKQINKKIHK